MKNFSALLPCVLLATLSLSSASLASAAPDLTSAVVPDFRGWEDTYYAGWTDWTGLDPSGFFALADDPASNAPFARVTVSASGSALTSGGTGVLCTNGLPTPFVQYAGAAGDGPVREVIVQIKTPGGASPANVLLEYLGDVPFNTDTDFLPPSEVIQLAPDEVLYRFFAAQKGLNVGTFGTFAGFTVWIETAGNPTPGCVDAIQLDVRHQLSGESDSTCATGNLNSLSVFAGLDAGGSIVSANNLIQLTASGIPDASFGFILGSQTLQYVPCGGCFGQGELCLGGPISRIFPPGLGGADRSFSTTLDLTAIPSPLGPIAVIPGSTWHFQGWYRDANPIPTSNATQTISLLFQ